MFTYGLSKGVPEKGMPIFIFFDEKAFSCGVGKYYFTTFAGFLPLREPSYMYWGVGKRQAIRFWS